MPEYLQAYIESPNVCLNISVFALLYDHRRVILCGINCLKEFIYSFSCPCYPTFSFGQCFYTKVPYLSFFKVLCKLNWQITSRAATSWPLILSRRHNIMLRIFFYPFLLLLYPSSSLCCYLGCPSQPMVCIPGWLPLFPEPDLVTWEFVILLVRSTINTNILLEILG